MVRTEFIEKGKHKNPKFVEPEKVYTGEVDPILEEHLVRTENSYRPYLSYNPDEYLTRRKIFTEKVNQQFMREYPHCVEKKLIGITRVLLQKSQMFEFGKDRNYELDVNGEIKSALYYSLMVTVYDFRSMERGVKDIIDQPGAQVTYRIGRYDAPVIKLKYDHNNNPIDADVIGYNHRYYVNDSPDEIRRLISEYGDCPGHKSVAIGTVSGPVYLNDRKYAVFNNDDFADIDIPTLIAANTSGFLSPEENYGIKKYLKYKKRKEELEEKGFRLTPKQYLEEQQEEYNRRRQKHKGK